MSILGLLIPTALLLGLLGLIGFFWALRHGQFDDPDGAARRVLLDDDVASAVNAGERLRLKGEQSDAEHSAD